MLATLTSQGGLKLRIVSSSRRDSDGVKKICGFAGHHNRYLGSVQTTGPETHAFLRADSSQISALSERRIISTSSRPRTEFGQTEL